MMNKNSEKHPIANDAVIADFFKRSLKIITVMILITVGLVYYFSQEKKEIIIEKAFQASNKLSHNVKQRSIRFKTKNGATGVSRLPEAMGLGNTLIDCDNDGGQDVVFANGTNWKWNHAFSLVPTMDDFKSQINSVTKSYLSEAPEDFILGISNKSIDSIIVKFQNKHIRDFCTPPWNE